MPNEYGTFTVEERKTLLKIALGIVVAGSVTTVGVAATFRPNGLFPNTQSFHFTSDHDTAKMSGLSDLKELCKKSSAISQSAPK